VGSGKRVYGVFDGLAPNIKWRRLYGLQEEEVGMFETRKEFLKELLRLSGLKSIEEADRVARVVIGLIKARIGPELSDRVAEAVPPDLRMGWRSIALPAEVMELQEIMFEMDEIAEVQLAPSEPPVPYDYG